MYVRPNSSIQHAPFHQRPGGEIRWARVLAYAERGGKQRAMNFLKRETRPQPARRAEKVAELNFRLRAARKLNLLHDNCECNFVFCGEASGPWEGFKKSRSDKFNNGRYLCPRNLILLKTSSEDYSYLWWYAKKHRATMGQNERHVTVHIYGCRFLCSTFQVFTKSKLQVS